jgi:hypothetical protein
MKFGKGMADKAGRAMKNRTPDKMGRAMVKKFNVGGPTGMAPPRFPGMDAQAAGQQALLQNGMAPPLDPRMEAARNAAAQNQGMKRGTGMKKGGKVKSGGSYRKAADGIAHKGKTKGKMIKMAYGGKC